MPISDHTPSSSRWYTARPSSSRKLSSVTVRISGVSALRLAVQSMFRSRSSASGSAISGRSVPGVTAMYFDTSLPDASCAPTDVETAGSFSTLCPESELRKSP